MDNRRARRGRDRGRHLDPEVVTTGRVFSTIGCVHCQGSGLSPSGRLCRCAAIRILHTALGLYHQWDSVSTEPLCPTWRPTRYGCFRLQTRIREEFRADIHLVAQRALTAAEYELFVAHYVHGLPFRVCLRIWPSAVPRSIFHAFTRIARKTGEAFWRAGLVPSEKYFGRQVAQPCRVPGEEVNILRKGKFKLPNDDGLSKSLGRRTAQKGCH